MCNDSFFQHVDMQCNFLYSHVPHLEFFPIFSVHSCSLVICGGIFVSHYFTYISTGKQPARQKKITHDISTVLMPNQTTCHNTNIGQRKCHNTITTITPASLYTNLEVIKDSFLAFSLTADSRLLFSWTVMSVCPRWEWTRVGGRMS